jgi:hypothetical protein
MSNRKAIEFHHAIGKFYWALVVDDKYQDPTDEREIQLDDFDDIYLTIEQKTSDRINDELYARAVNDEKAFIENKLYLILGFAGYYTGYDLTRYFVQPFTWGDLTDESKLNEQESAVDSDYPF